MSEWIPLLVRAEDYPEFADLVAKREIGRGDGLAPVSIAQDLMPGAGDGVVPSVADADLANYPAWPEALLRRLAESDYLTAQRWTMALDVVAAAADQVWFTTSEIAERSGMGINAWRDAPRKFPQHIKQHYADAPLTRNGELSWPLQAKSITRSEVSWAMPPAAKETWRKIRGL